MHLVFIWLGWKDLNPRNNGVRVRCLTTWRHPNIRFCPLSFSDLFIISHFFVFVKSFFKFLKKIFLNFFQTVLRLTHDDLYSISHSAVFVKHFSEKILKFCFFLSNVISTVKSKQKAGRFCSSACLVLKKSN